MTIPGFELGPPRWEAGAAWENILLGSCKTTFILSLFFFVLFVFIYLFSVLVYLFVTSSFVSLSLYFLISSPITQNVAILTPYDALA
jgi:hypothetical protein